MGLDAVELVLAVEDIFGIEIPDTAAERMATVGDLHAYIVAELQRQGRTALSADIAMDMLRNLICFQLRVPRESVVPGARFVQDLHLDA